MMLLKNYIYNRGVYRQVFIAITTLFAISFFTSFSTVLNLLLLAWGGILILRDVCTKKIILKSKRFIPLILFMMFYFVTIYINRNLNLFENLKIFFLTALQFFILFAFDDEEEIDTVNYDITTFNKIIIYITFGATFLSLLTYLFGVSFVINGHVVGVENGMLNGIYAGSNTGGPLAAISIVATLVNYKLKNGELKKFDYMNVVIQLIYIYMTNSRATLYCFLIFAIIVSVFYFKGIKEKVIAIGGVTLTYLLSKIVNVLMYYIYKCISVIINILHNIYVIAKKYVLRQANIDSGKNIFNISGESIVNEVVEKEITMGFLNGRAQLWQCGVKIIKDNLAFGVGSRNVYEVALKYDSITNLPGIEGGGMHNIIMQVLVSNGILGFASLFIFIVSIICKYIKYLIAKESKYYELILLVSGLIFMLLVNNMAENTIFYTASYTSTVFWTYLGYGIFVINKDLRGEKNY